MKIHIIYAFDGKWWTAEAPFLRGAHSQGRSRSAARKNLLRAIRELLAIYEERGEDPPFTAQVEVEFATIPK